jgi:nitrogen fixation NifU-like protein
VSQPPEGRGASAPHPPLESLYQQLILDHYRRPRNRGELPEKTVEVHMANPVCGDEIRLQLEIADDVIRTVRFVGQGCSISQASISMMTSLLQGKKLDEADAVAAKFTRLMHGDESMASDRALGDLRALKGVSKFPVRIKCALLGFDALLEALKRSGHEPSTSLPASPPGDTP